MSVFKVGDKVVRLDLDSPEEIAAGHRIDHAVDVNEMGDDTHIENPVSPLCKVVGEVMRSEFEKAYSPNPHKSPFTEVSFNDEKQIYEPLNPPLDHVARSLNAAWFGYRIRQTKVDELQKENAALVHVIKSRDIQLENEKHEYDELMNKLVDSMMENKELQKRVDAALKILYTKKKMYVDMIIEIEQVIKYGSDESN